MSTYHAFKGMAYQTSKAALNMMTVAMGNELKAEMGGAGAMLEIPDGSVRLATLPDDGPTSGYFRKDKPIVW